jgi:alanine racemase
MISLDDLLNATGGQLYGPAHATTFTTFCFDSRLVRPGELFLAVKTERGDGHDYIAAACRDGAAGVLCERPVDLDDLPVTCIVVPGTQAALQAWARFVLARSGTRVVGVTGSVGKTSTKEAIAHVLADRYAVFRNRANYNGRFGLPIALGELTADRQVAVLEMACDGHGEMTDLARMAPPQVAVVTAVAPVHLDTFDSLDAIAAEKAQLVAALPADGLAVLNYDDPRVRAMAGQTAARIVTFGLDPSADLVATHITVDAPSHLSPFPSPGRGEARGGVGDEGGITFKLRRQRFGLQVDQMEVRLPLLGRHQAYVALAAAAVGLAFGLDLPTIANRLASLPRVPGRLNPLPGRHGSLILDDSYNASPAATLAALETLATLPARRRIAVLGDMTQLGAFAEDGHRQVGQRAAQVVDLLVTRGEQARLIADEARRCGLNGDRVIVTYTAEDAARAVEANLDAGDVVLVKGAVEARMEQVVQRLLADPGQASRLLVRQDRAWQQIVVLRPDRPTWVEIDLDAIAHNVRRLKQMAYPAQLMVTLKADAYGHGAVQVAQTALLNGATWLGVACFSEGVVLRRAGIDAPILMLGYLPAWQARDALRHDLTATVFDLDVARALSQAAIALDRQARVHVKVDTGMGRLGLFPDQVLDFVRELRRLPHLVIEGIFTHLSVADTLDGFSTTYTAHQLAAFQQVLDELAAAGIEIPLVHAENSAALLRASSSSDHSHAAGFEIPPVHVENSTARSPLPAPRFPLHASRSTLTLVRPGIAVYGLDPSPDVHCPPDFRPALTWKTLVAQVKELPTGSYVGYGAAHRTGRPTCIAVIPVGYADGFRRSPRHWGQVLVRGQRAPVVGRVCMDQTMIDVTDVPGVRQGDEVVLIGAQGDQHISAEEVAERLGTINYEVVSAILARVPREAV